jgi:hypothetical protein
MEMIGALAVIAVLVAVALPNAIRYLDRVAADREVATLKTLGDRFQKAILRQGTIPAQSGWRSFVAAEAGMSSNSVSVNPRYKKRAFVADPDPGGWLGTHLPFTNAPSGSATSPANARVMFISSLGSPLPANIESGMDTAEFQTLWTTSDGSIPPSSSTIWNGWSGDPYDIKIQRINLGALFNHLVLSTYTAATNGQFKINGTPLQAATAGAGFSAYFLQGTPVDLVTGSPDNNTNHTFILNEDVSFVYEYGVWRNSIVGGETYGLGDVSGIVAAFLAATPNQKAQLTNGNAQQVAIVNSFVQYMSNYANWAASTPAFPGSMRSPFMVDLQKNMMSNVWGIFEGSHYPTNGSACVIP